MSEAMLAKIGRYFGGLILMFFFMPIAILSVVLILIQRLWLKAPIYYLWGIAVVLLTPCLFMGVGFLKFAPLYVIMKLLPVSELTWMGLSNIPFSLTKVIYGSMVFSMLIVSGIETNRFLNPKYKNNVMKERSRTFHYSKLNQWLVKRKEMKVREQQ